MASPPPRLDSPTPIWRRQLSEQLQRLPASRRRGLRPFQPGSGAQLQSTDRSRADSADGDLCNGLPLLDLASNDYLGLSRHPAVLAAAAAELERSGLGAGASRLISGSRLIHAELERELAVWLGRERVLLFPSGFQANPGESGG